MSLISLVVVLLIAGLIMYLVSIAPFVDARMKQIINFVIIVVVVIYLVQIFVGPLPDLKIGR